MCVCDCACVIVCVCVRARVDTCLLHAVPFRALQLWFLSLYITFFLSFLCFCVFLSPPPFFLFLASLFFFFSLYLLAVLLALVPMPRPPL